jgi:multicomponent Na+:H+ antiporter subunit E
VTTRRGLPVARAILVRTMLAGLTWWAFTEGDLRSPGLAVLVVVAAVASSLPLVRPDERHDRRISIAGLVRFVPYFLAVSFVGAVDVARRAVLPGPPTRPGFLDHPLRLPPGPGRLLVVFVVSLMPGILSAELGETHLRVHALDTEQDTDDAIAGLEVRIADLLDLQPPA